VYLNFVGITMDGTKDMNYAIILIIQRLKKCLCKRRYQLFLDLGQKYTNKNILFIWHHSETDQYLTFV